MFNTNDKIKKRVYALTTDLFIVVLTNYFLMASFTQFLRTIFFHFPFKAQLFLIKKLSIMSSASLMVLTFAYFSLFYFVTNGRTIGKTLFGLKVISNAEEITLIQSMKRSLAYLVCAFLGSFLFALSFFRKDQKSLADIISETEVDWENSELKIQSEFGLILNDELKSQELQTFSSEDNSEKDEAA